MRTNFIAFLLLLCSVQVIGQDSPFGKITITPYVAAKADLDATAQRLFEEKLNQVVTANGVTGGYDKKFIITPSVNVLSANETANIPQKTSMKVSVTLYVGDGEAGNKFGAYNMELTGVGDSYKEALYSAIRKMNVKDAGLHEMIEQSKQRIVAYYNAAAPKLIKEAEGYMSSNNYEEALSRLSVIPFACSYYDKAQTLVRKCGAKIIERDNNTLLPKAKAAWSSNPNEVGAQEAASYVSQVILSSNYYKNEVDRLNRQMANRLSQLENKRLEIEETKILSQERLDAERINASARVSSAFFGALPKLVYNIFSWF